MALRPDDIRLDHGCRLYDWALELLRSRIHPAVDQPERYQHELDVCDRAASILDGD
jgi:hypothetical protein